MQIIKNNSIFNYIFPSSIILIISNPIIKFQDRRTDQGCDRDMSSEIKHMSISDDFLALEQARRANEEIAENTTHKSFMEKRHRHSSVPQTARPQVEN